MAVKKIFLKILCAFLLTLPGLSLIAQVPEASVFIGLSNYLGDLQQKPVVPAQAREVLGVTYKHPLNKHFWLQGGLGYARLYAWDGNNEAALRARNLSFESKVIDAYAALEFRLLPEDRARLIPYAFAGLGGFRFNPYVRYGNNNERVFLQPLGTEGQGLPEYPSRSMYTLTAWMIPMGGGLLYHIDEKWIVGAALRFQYTFTDYLDDVSTRYALQAPLLRDRGPLAVELAWRRDEFDGRPYPEGENIRGNPDVKDMYYYAGLFFGFKLQPAKKGGMHHRRSKAPWSCPAWN